MMEALLWRVRAAVARLGAECFAQAFVLGSCARCARRRAYEAKSKA
jgi:hypothetical protein